MTSSIVTASALSSPRNTIARLSPTRSASTPQLSKILANGKSYAVSIVIGWWRAFIRAKSGTRTLSWVVFGFKASAAPKKSGLPHRQPRMRANSLKRALDITRSPGHQHRIQARAVVMSMPPQRRRLPHKRLAGRKISSTDKLHYREDRQPSKVTNDLGCPLESDCPRLILLAGRSPHLLFFLQSGSL